MIVVDFLVFFFSSYCVWYIGSLAHLFSIAASAVQKISAQRDRAEEEEVEVM